MMKHRSEHKLLIDKAKSRNLIDDQILFVLAIREVEDGSEGNEFNLKVVKDTSLSIQVDWLIDFIVSESKEYLDYTLALGILEPIGFVPFFAGHNLMVKEGMFHSPFWVANVCAAIEEISKEYYGSTDVS